jgi:hypothetical protein
MGSKVISNKNDVIANWRLGHKKNNELTNLKNKLPTLLVKLHEARCFAWFMF